ncbi:transcriptional regulator, TetR family [Segniliparus rotundus DSM 44985]|uniref:Transcriptional regulator, TetR family n=1 Tax=Segniliparus rotundus (strain ATCC BAA-972 / CDC 1076 / CIP 108378 / DSM 44985 / JCM 13578) TaxID=640132 RepID=D6ZEU8_SEGRD|nr:TetR/AcrR family transcriptional regulator [Segniliparus rotundus]ADG97472.1 transcriptional regulator, TetR family [Segniliparus rotundus DSM 44985]
MTTALVSQNQPDQQHQPGLRERKRTACAAQIHEAAIRLVAEHGYEAVTIAQIAETAAVSPKTVFNYWGSKDGAILGVGETGPDSAWSQAYLAPENTDHFGPIIDLLATRSAGQRQEHARLMLRVFQEQPRLVGLRLAHAAETAEAFAALCAAKLGQLRPDHDAQKLAQEARLIVSIALAVARHAWQEWARDEDGRPLETHLATSLELHQKLCNDMISANGGKQ